MPDEIGILAYAAGRCEAAIKAKDPAAERRRDEFKLLADCVEICRTYQLERVIIANIRARLRDRFEVNSDMNLFGMALLHHVAEPGDDALLDCVKWVFWNLLRRKDGADSAPVHADAG